MTHLKFPSLEQFADVYARETYGDKRRKVALRAKIKLHGTCMGIRISQDGVVTAQAKNVILSEESDQNNFHRWAAPQFGAWAGARGEESVTFYGEWAGPGVNKGDAIQKTGKKRYYIFAVGIGEAPHFRADDRADGLLTAKWMITCPKAIEAMLPEGINEDEVVVLPYEGIPYEFNFASKDDVDYVLNDLNAAVDRVAVEDPFVARNFGIQHPGEGYVLVPHATKVGDLTLEQYARLTFKAKTEKHRVKKQAKSATARDPLPESVGDFIDTYCTPARMRQALDEVSEGRVDVRKLGDIIRWMTADVEKEGQRDIAALTVPFDRVKPEIATATRAWVMAQRQGVGA
jgi:hypothetical protein